MSHANQRCNRNYNRNKQCTSEKRRYFIGSTYRRVVLPGKPFFFWRIDFSFFSNVSIRTEVCGLWPASRLFRYGMGWTMCSREAYTCVSGTASSCPCRSCNGRICAHRRCIGVMPRRNRLWRWLHDLGRRTDPVLSYGI